MAKFREVNHCGSPLFFAYQNAQIDYIKMLKPA